MEEQLREAIIERIRAELSQALAQRHGQAIGEGCMPLAITILTKEFLTTNQLTQWVAQGAQGWIDNRWPAVLATLLDDEAEPGYPRLQNRTSASHLRDCARAFRCRDLTTDHPEFVAFRDESWVWMEHRLQIQREQAALAARLQRMGIHLMADEPLFENALHAAKNRVFLSLEDETFAGQAIFGEGYRYGGIPDGEHFFRETILGYCRDANGQIWQDWLRTRITQRFIDVVRRLLRVELEIIQPGEHDHEGARAVAHDDTQALGQRNADVNTPAYPQERENDNEGVDAPGPLLIRAGIDLDAGEMTRIEDEFAQTPDRKEYLVRLLLRNVQQISVETLRTILRNSSEWGWQGLTADDLYRILLRLNRDAFEGDAARQLFMRWVVRHTAYFDPRDYLAGALPHNLGESRELLETEYQRAQELLRSDILRKEDALAEQRVHSEEYNFAWAQLRPLLGCHGEALRSATDGARDLSANHTIAELKEALDATEEFRQKAVVALALAMKRLENQKRVVENHKSDDGNCARFRQRRPRVAAPDKGVPQHQGTYWVRGYERLGGLFDENWQASYRACRWIEAQIQALLGDREQQQEAV